MATATQTPAQIPNDLVQLLREHIDFVVRSSDAYDEGYESEAKRFAVLLRTLLHDAAPFRSLMANVQGLQGNFISTAIPRKPEKLGAAGKHGDWIRTAKLDGRPIPFAPLDLSWYARWLPFADWWNEIVFLDDERNALSRKDIVVLVAGKDAGSNFDLNLTFAYQRLSMHETWGFAEDRGAEAVKPAERAAVRQVVHELLRTLLPPYRKLPKQTNDARLASAMDKACERPADVPPMQTFRRNDVCPCGSGKRVKFCHG